MRKAPLALAAAAVLGLTAVAAPSPAEAHWRGGGFFPAVAGGLIAGAVIGGMASNAYAYGPGYGYYGGYGAMAAYYGGYYGGGYAPAYYGGYYDNPYPVVRYRRVVRPAYAYYGASRTVLPSRYRAHCVAGNRDRRKAHGIGTGVKSAVTIGIKTAKKRRPRGAAFKSREEGQLTPLRLPFPAPGRNPGPWHRRRGRRTRSRPSARCRRSGSRP